MVIIQHAVLNLECLEIARYSSRSLMMQQAILSWISKGQLE